MIVGIGTDICEISRIADLLEKQGERFIERILTADEIAAKTEITADFLAKRYAAKEACAKAVGTGIGAALSFQDIIVSNLESGAPKLCVTRAEFADLKWHLSMSDEKEYALAFVVAETS